MAPLERLKILLQVQDYIKQGGEAPAKYRTLGQSLRQIHAEEGVKGYFKGNGANCVRVFPYVAIQFATFEKLKPLLISDGAETLSPLQKLFGGAMAGVVSVCITYPLDAARARLTVQGGLAKTAHTGILNVLSTIVRTEGVRGVYRGMLPTIWGIAPYVGLNFTVFETLRSTVPRNEHGEPDAMYLLACGAVAGACGQTAAYPMDILRRRFQLSAMRGKATEYTSTLGGLRTIVREEGVRGLYKGLTPNFIKVVPSIAIMFTTNEMCLLERSGARLIVHNEREAHDARHRVDVDGRRQPADSDDVRRAVHYAKVTRRQRGASCREQLTRAAVPLLQIRIVAHAKQLHVVEDDVVNVVGRLGVVHRHTGRQVPHAQEAAGLILVRASVRRPLLATPTGQPHLRLVVSHRSNPQRRRRGGSRCSCRLRA